MFALNLAKTIERGTWRSIGRRVAGLSPMNIPIGGMSVSALLNHTGGSAYRIG